MEMKRRHADWKESAVVTALAAIVTAWLCRRAFSSWLFAEAFVYLGSYVNEGGFVGAIASPHGRIFFRPSLWAVNLFFNLVLPPLALAYHLRNFFGVVLCALLLHRLLLRLDINRRGRIAAVLFFSASKVHFTTIGYVGTFSTILVSMWALAMALFFLRWLDMRHKRDYAIAILFLTLLVFSKDYGSASVLILFALVFIRRSTIGWRRSLVFVVVPLVLLTGSYLMARRAVLKETSYAGVYSPSLDRTTVVKKVVDGLSVSTNLTLDGSGTVGERGLSRLVARGNKGVARAVEVTIAMLLAALMVVAFMRSPAPSHVLIASAWIIALVLPTFVTRNHQVYYFQEIAVAGAIVLGAVMTRGDATTRKLIIAALAIVVINAEASEGPRGYVWQHVARRASQVRPVVQAYKHSNIEHLVIRGSDEAFWQFALRADGLAPFLPELFGKRESLEVTVTSLNTPFPRTPRTVVVDMDPRPTVVYDSVTKVETR